MTIATAPRTYGLCSCGHLQVQHPTPFDCGACTCGQYDEILRIPAADLNRFATDPLYVSQVIRNFEEAGP